MAILETKDLRKIYGSGENEVHALDGVSISVEEGEFVAVIGTSGSGKSTLLNMIGGLDRPTSGSVTIRGKELLKMKDEELTIFRRRNIGFVFQNYNLLPVLNVYENIVYPLKLLFPAAKDPLQKDIGSFSSPHVPFLPQEHTLLSACYSPLLPMSVLRTGRLYLSRQIISRLVHPPLCCLRQTQR